MPDTFEYWAFVSYSSHDVRWARWLQRALESYTIPGRLVGHSTAAGPAPRRLRPIFRDRTELAVESDLSASIAQALAHSAFLVVVCSPDASRSRWVNQEIRQFRALHGRERILPVIVAGKAGGHRDDAFPPALLEHEQKQDAPARSTPLAADLRPGGDGRRITRLRLVAGMLGVGLDDLIRRDTQRRHRQMVSVSAASITGMAIAAALATVAWVSRNKAVKERGQADRLVAFMLDDLHDRLAQSRRLDLMEKVAHEALDYYAAEDSSDLDAASLEKRSAAVNMVGEIELQRGDLAEAAKAFSAASATTAELLSRGRNDGQRVYAHAQSVFWVGEIARQRGEMAQAEASFLYYLELARRLTALDSRNDDWLAEVDNASSDLGTLYLQLGRAPEALRAFRQSLAVSEILVGRRPTDLDRQMDVAQSHAWLADALEANGKLRAARAERDQESDVYRNMLARDPHYQKAEFSAAIAEQAHADLGRLLGDTAG